MNKQAVHVQVQRYLRASMGPERLQAALTIMPVPPLLCSLRINLCKVSRSAAMEQLQHELHESGQSEMSCGPPFAHPQLDNVIMLRGEGPRQVDLSSAGAPRGFQLGPLLI